MIRYVVKGFSSKVFRLGLLFLLLILSCQTEEVKTKAPEDLLGQEEFTNMVADMFLIEGLRSMHTAAEHKELNPTEAYYNGIWKESGVSQGRFLRSFEYYRSDRKIMESIYAKAAKIIKAEEDQMKKGTTRPLDVESDQSDQEE